MVKGTKKEEKLPAVVEGQVRNYLEELNPCKSIGPDRLHQRVISNHSN